MARRGSFILPLLIIAWIALIVWQVAEHHRVYETARAALVIRGRDITTTLGLVIRSQRRFGTIVNQERLEPALNELVKTDEVDSIALLNIEGEVVASAGVSSDRHLKRVDGTAEVWGEHTVTLINLMDLGTNSVREGEGARPIILLPRRDPASPGTNASDRLRSPPPQFWGGPGGPGGPQGRPGGFTNGIAAQAFSATNDILGPLGTNTSAPRDPNRRWFGKPPWMNDQDYEALIQKQGLHSFVVVLSTQALTQAVNRDLWLRVVIGAFAAAAAAGLGLAWRTAIKSSELQLRLIRASELNNHLKGMNIAAAGLAHETRNPLNIVRGLAQLISKQPDASAEVRGKAMEITSEVDRVTAQLNQFINYSKPREVRFASIALGGIVGEVVRALNYDIEEKAVQIKAEVGEGMIEADEQLLRQALFNLLMNAVQSVERFGIIDVVALPPQAGELSLEIRDNGPGVPASDRQEIFKPYFTTRREGTGLGLAVVQQIILAHGWEISCGENTGGGAVFRLDHLKLSGKRVE